MFLSTVRYLTKTTSQSNWNKNIFGKSKIQSTTRLRKQTSKRYAWSLTIRSEASLNLLARILPGRGKREGEGRPGASLSNSYNRSSRLDSNLESLNLIWCTRRLYISAKYALLWVHNIYWKTDRGNASLLCLNPLSKTDNYIQCRVNFPARLPPANSAVSRCFMCGYSEKTVGIN